MLKFPIVFMSLMLFACGQQNAKNNNATTITASKPAATTNVPEFNADSAYTSTAPTLTSKNRSLSAHECPIPKRIRPAPTISRTN